MEWNEIKEGEIYCCDGCGGTAGIYEVIKKLDNEDPTDYILVKPIGFELTFSFFADEFICVATDQMVLLQGKRTDILREANELKKQIINLAKEEKQ